MSTESQLNVLAHAGALRSGTRCEVESCRLCWTDAERENERRAKETHAVEDELTSSPTRVRLHALTEDQSAKLRAASDPTLRWFVPRWKWEVKLTWTNWTFGAWWGKIGRKYMIGIDVGPLEIVRTRAFVRSTRAKHRPGSWRA